MAVNVQRAAASDGGLRRIRSLRPEGELVRCATESSEILIPRVPALHLRTSDALRTEGPDSPVHEFLALCPIVDTIRSSFTSAGSDTPHSRNPTSEKEFFGVRAEVLETGLGIRALHLANAAVTDYFYRLGQKARREPTLYDILKVTRTASRPICGFLTDCAESSWRPPKPARSTCNESTAALNLLAHPELRSCYDALLQDPNAPAAFPYGAFGQCVVAGELAADGNTFFVRRILAYLPNQCQRQFRAPLRRIEYLNEHAVYRDSRRRAEVYIDRTLLPIGWDPTWNQWRHLIGPKIGIAALRQSGRLPPMRWRMAPGPMANRPAQSSCYSSAREHRNLVGLRAPRLSPLRRVPRWNSARQDPARAGADRRR